MKVPYSWLKDFISIKLKPEEVASDLSLSVIGVDSVEEAGRDKVLNLDVTYNRGDLLSIAGVARELAAMYTLKFKAQEVPFEPQGASRINIKSNSKLSKTYSLTKISDLNYKITPSQIKERLEGAGMRSVNLWADLTNYVMLEWGQPFHAFDGEKVSRRDPTVSIEVRNAKPGEDIKTLDGLTRRLNSEDIVIADRRGAIAIAGVMGGEDTEVDEGTTEILLEAAIFDPISIRKTARRLGLRSEASNRFEHYISPENLLISINILVQHYLKYGKGKVTGFNLVGETKLQVEPVVLTQKDLDEAAGIEIPVPTVKEALKLLRFKVLSSEQGLLCWPPHWRGDIRSAEDVVEEVLRMYGYENIPPKPIRTVISEAPENRLEGRRKLVSTMLAGAGFNEIKTYPFVSTASLIHHDPKNLIKVKNPISAETEYLRSTLVFNLAEAAQLNAPRFPKGGIFELEKVYPLSGEYLALGGLLWGEDQLYLKLKGVLEEILKRAGVEAEFLPLKAKDGRFHPTQAASIVVEKETLGIIGTLHPHLEEAYQLKNAAVFEINFELLSKLSSRWTAFTLISNYPEIYEDFSFSLDEKHSLAKLMGEIKGTSGLVKAVEITDRYLKDGVRSITLRITFQSDEKGLSAEDIKPIRGKIQALIRKNKGILRD